MSRPTGFHNHDRTLAGPHAVQRGAIIEADTHDVVDRNEPAMAALLSGQRSPDVRLDVLVYPFPWPDQAGSQHRIRATLTETATNSVVPFHRGDGREAYRDTPDFDNFAIHIEINQLENL